MNIKQFQKIFWNQRKFLNKNENLYYLEFFRILNPENISNKLEELQTISKKSWRFFF